MRCRLRSSPSVASGASVPRVSRCSASLASAVGSAASASGAAASSAASSSAAASLPPRLPALLRRPGTPPRAARSGRRSARRGRAPAPRAARASCVSGATITPTSWLFTTSSGGSFASSSTSAPVSAFPERTPPRRVEHLRPRGRRRRGPSPRRPGRRRSTNAIAVGPSSSASSASAPAASAARRVSVFLTTVELSPRCSRSVARRPIELAVGQPAVVRDDQRLGRAQPLGELRDDLLLLGLLHVFTSSRTIRARL